MANVLLLSARSVTCKNHSINLKRAVQRSKPFDIVLAEWQRKSGKGSGSAAQNIQGKSNGSAAITVSEKKSKKKKDTTLTSNAKTKMVLTSTPMFLGEESESDEGDDRLNRLWDEDVDSEEEADLVLQGLSAARSRLRPFPGSELAGTAMGSRRPSKWKSQIMAAFLPARRASQ